MKSWKLCFSLFLIPIILLAVSCGYDDEIRHAPFNPKSNQFDKEAVEVIEVQGDFGDVEILFKVTSSSWTSKSVSLDYKGACQGDTQWAPAVVSGSTSNLQPDSYKLVWHSWEQEAGCKGQVSLRLKVNDTNEKDDSTAFYLNNTRPGDTGFHKDPLVDQGINPREEQVFDRALDALLDDPSVDFVATRYADSYEVHAARGSVIFSRVQTNKGFEYVIEQVDGENPIARQDPTWIPNFLAETAAGTNPNNIAIPEKGYPQGDPRLSFIEPADDSYPFGYERIAATFDHPNAADFLINWKSYSHTNKDLAYHGSLNISQSRCPLIFWGAGIRPGAGTDAVSRQVDIAPTVAKLLDFDKITGVNEHGIISHDVYLERQDGHAIEQVLNGETSDRVIILVSDGLNHNQLHHQINQRPDKVPHLVRLRNQGASIGYGSTANWPSITYPGHNIIGSGMYAGHHGIVDNDYYDRRQQKHLSPINQIVFQDRFWNPVGPGETLFQAAHRNFGDWSRFTGQGAFTASLFDPATHGADKSDVDFRDRSGEVPFPPIFLDVPPEIPGVDLAFINDMDILLQEVAMQLAFIELYHLYTSEKIGMPMVTILGHLTTDAVGHTFGPHSNNINLAIEQLDAYVGVLFGWLEDWGIADTTTIILTSDHGMQLGDPSRSGWPINSLDAAGIKRAANTDLAIYLKVMVTQISANTVTIGQEQTIEFYVTDEDFDTPIEGVLIETTDGESETSAMTDATGRATVVLTPTTHVEVTVSHEEFSTMHYTLEGK